MSFPIFLKTDLSRNLKGCGLLYFVRLFCQSGGGSVRNLRVVLLSVLILCACNHESPGSGKERPPAVTRPVADSGVTVTLRTDQPRYKPGQPITLSLTVSNPTERPAVLRFSSAQRYEFTIQDQGGKSYWQWGAGRMFAQVLGQETLASGDSLVYRESFRGQLPPGTYRAVGTILATDKKLPAEAQVTVGS